MFITLVSVACIGDLMTFVGSLKEKPVITGVGCTKFGSVLETPELKGLSFQELMCQAAFELSQNAEYDVLSRDDTRRES